ncbi:VWA domain-containing protein [Marinobacterium mangrovicola]|uniref:Ca-activated chloride channel family protein n=1 Tax=Marinobacterium mangrovicola TaxID=1476959 RepID=A0A4R1GBI3_9GAMM|nr:VWA domain-containing protein [Marinobacterium mangrovicola]TCK04050.1 Ca-activated chloride channel family protein [Marinobacterium mangrovicola]
MNRNFKIGRWMMPLLLMLAFISTTLRAQEVALDLSLATPVMVADQVQKAFIKISLDGFELPGERQRTPANVAIVLDRSGSMSGEKIAQAREAAIMALERLDQRDIVSIVAYDNAVEVVVPATKLSEPQPVYRAIRRIRAGGNTALYAGVSQGARELRKFLDRNRVNRVILLSDGLANVGPQTPSELGRLGMELSREGISVTTIGLGLGYNEDLMTQLAGMSDGNHAFVENAADLARIFQYEFGDVMSVVAQDLVIEIQCLNGVRPLRLLGREGEVSGDRVSTRLNQLYSEQEKYLVLEVEVPAQQAGKELELAKVQIDYANLATQRQSRLDGKVLASFTTSEAEVEQALDKPALESAVEQVANEYSRKAVERRDQGDVAGARSLMEESAAYLGAQAEALASPELKAQEEEALQDADKLSSEQDWNRQRKELREKQYKRSNQQSY